MATTFSFNIADDAKAQEAINRLAEANGWTSEMGITKKNFVEKLIKQHFKIMNTQAKLTMLQGTVVDDLGE